MSDICSNCGAWHGLHQVDTDRCPLGGIERFPDAWGNTYYARQDDSAERIATLRADIADSKASEVLGVTVINTHLRTMKEQAETIRALRAAMTDIKTLTDGLSIYQDIADRAIIALDATK